MKAEPLFDAGPRSERRTGSTALVVIEAKTCPACGGELERLTWDQRPLLRHGGYGAALRTVRDWCRCGWSLVREISEVKP